MRYFRLLLLYLLVPLSSLCKLQLYSIVHPPSKMAQLLHSLCLSSTPSSSLPPLSPSNLSSLHPILNTSLCTPQFKPISLSLNNHPRLHPICCSSSATLTSQNPSAEPTQDEDSTTRLLASNVPWTATADDIRALFQQYGTVLDVELAMHSKKQNRNRGLAFVEMGSAEEAAQALAKLEAYEYEGRSLKLNYAKPKKKSPPPVSTKPPVLFNLFVANLSFEARAKDLKEFFQSSGSNVVSAEVIFNENPRRSTGYGFVSFKTKKEADEVLASFQGKELMGREIRLARSRRFVKLESEANPQSEDGEDTSTNSTEQETVDSS